jgi:hypothetical protein
MRSRVIKIPRAGEAPLAPVALLERRLGIEDGPQLVDVDLHIPVLVIGGHVHPLLHSLELRRAEHAVPVGVQQGHQARLRRDAQGVGTRRLRRRPRIVHRRGAAQGEESRDEKGGAHMRQEAITLSWVHG